jgi:hypothetical protein
MSSPSISVMNCGTAFNFASHVRQSYSLAQLARERLNRRELHVLRCVGDRFPFRPPGRLEAPAQVSQLSFRNVDLKRANRGLVICRLTGLLCDSGWGRVSSSRVSVATRFNRGNRSRASGRMAARHGISSQVSANRRITRLQAVVTTIRADNQRPNDRCSVDRTCRTDGFATLCCSTSWNTRCVIPQ